MSHRRAKRLRTMLRLDTGPLTAGYAGRKIYQAVKATDKANPHQLPTLKELHRVRTDRAAG